MAREMGMKVDGHLWSLGSLAFKPKARVFVGEEHGQLCGLELRDAELAEKREALTRGPSVSTDVPDELRARPSDITG